VRAAVDRVVAMMTNRYELHAAALALGLDAPVQR
jgi:hypothetical protein